MAKPIEFQTRTDPRKELEGKLAAAPVEHAEALLAAYELLETAHQHGILDLMRGAIGSKNAIAAKVSEYAAEEPSTQLMRNMLVLATLLSTMDLDGAINASADSPNRKAPSLWESFKVLRSEDGRRGFYCVALLLKGIGAGTKRQK